ncbi:site-specific DNA-methyltransferase [bacterium (Candidatus Blackallbacteria) CG18_big_fil_WC_8_21_14_2_50_49_26]|nr:MAG: site-specific DNA-methyltransferase [bacterium (Candidatus Blackallbacteria) CG18_big_fil_WC_8_21_14_2_50_49_26]
MKKQRLELTWIGKDQQPRLEPRILIEDPEKSYGDKKSPNMLIKGDNLLALKALEQDYTGKVKCVFIDPPYNTGSAFEHYDDGIEHSLWLGLMRDRLIILHRLLSEDGSLWVTLDDNEAHYFKVLCDEIFGRQNFVSTVIWEKSDSPKMDSAYFSSRHDYIFVYAKDKSKLVIKRLENESEPPSHFNKVDSNGRKYYLKPLRAMGSGDDTREARPTLYFSITAPDGSEIYPKKQDGSDGRWRWGKERVAKDVDLIEWVKGRDGWAPYYKIFADNSKGRPPETIWKHESVGTNRTSKTEIKNILKETTDFTTPKPEKLMNFILKISTNEGDIVLDSFLGSGTTAAVAHKMNRRWIGVELGEHCDTHCLHRLKKVVDGQDLGGITEVTDWQGGGGFKYYSLAPSLLKEDKYGHWVIDPCYNANMLAAAMAKHENFRYSPDEITFWKQGQSTEKDFIFTTTNFLTVEFLDRIHDSMQEDESLLICCKSFQDVCLDRHSNITVKKIPQMLLGRCEFGREDYSLHIITVPSVDDSPDEPALIAKPKPKRRIKTNQQGSFLDDLVGEDA